MQLERLLPVREIDLLAQVRCLLCVCVCVRARCAVLRLFRTIAVLRQLRAAIPSDPSKLDLALLLNLCAKFALANYFFFDGFMSLSHTLTRISRCVCCMSAKRNAAARLKRFLVILTAALRSSPLPTTPRAAVQSGCCGCGFSFFI
jgi:hypothetical protein